MAYRMTKTERIARDRLTLHMWHWMKDDQDVEDELRKITPAAWATLELDVDCDEPKEKVTLYLDRTVARAFKSMGKGYQARINRLLATWLQMRAAGMLETDEELFKRAMDVADKGKEAKARGEERPIFGVRPTAWPRDEVPEW
jgi:uncharacterized protein (DUF4415 family)